MPVRKGQEGIYWEWDFSKAKVFFKDALKKFSNPKGTKLWARMVQFLFMSWIGETFAKLGARRGHSAWKELSPRYKAWKTSQHKTKKGTIRGPYSERPLTKTGHLKASFVVGARSNVFQQERTRMFFGSRVPYAEHHQEPKVEGRPPKREIIFITQQDENDLGDLVTKWLVE
jgi:hypothetical protein